MGREEFEACGASLFPQGPTFPLYKRERKSSNRGHATLGEGLREEREKARRRRGEEGEEASPLFVDPGSIKFVEELDDFGSEVGENLLSNL